MPGTLTDAGAEEGDADATGLPLKRCRGRAFVSGQPAIAASASARSITSSELPFRGAATRTRARAKMEEVSRFSRNRTGSRSGRMHGVGCGLAGEVDRRGAALLRRAELVSAARREPSLAAGGGATAPWGGRGSTRTRCAASLPLICSGSIAPDPYCFDSNARA